MEGVSIIIPTFNGGEIFKESMRIVMNQEYEGEVQIIIIDSGSMDSTVSYAHDNGFLVREIPNKEFNHSKTRNLALKDAKYQFVIMMVQDCIPISRYWLSELVSSIKQDNVAGVCVRQIPHTDAELFARFEVDYHNEYLGDQVLLKKVGSDDLNKMSYDEALKTIRFDNVCAIYDKNVLLAHPFPMVSFGEDMAWAKSVLEAGYSVKYEPNIQVRHSHNRSSDYRFKRSLVDIISCAEIVGKTPQDLSFLTIHDYEEISERIEQIKEQALYDLSTKQKDIKFSSSISYAKKNKFVRSVYRKMMSVLKNNSTKIWISGFLSSVENHITCVIGEICKRYSCFTTVELAEVVNHVSAQIEGRLLGEIYSSCILAKVSTEKFDALVKENMKGV